VENERDRRVTTRLAGRPAYHPCEAIVPAGDAVGGLVGMRQAQAQRRIEISRNLGRVECKQWGVGLEGWQYGLSTKREKQ
jgi:hypothetical protein